MKPAPPKYARQFLNWFCREDCLEEIEGNLNELFEKHVVATPGKANRLYYWQVVCHFRPTFIKSFSSQKSISSIALVKHSFKIAFRNMLRYKSSFFINLAGLSTGLAAIILIWLWVYDEISMDRFHANGPRLYQVLKNIPENNAINTTEHNSDLLKDALQDKIPEIQKVTTITRAFNGILSVSQNGLKAIGKAADNDFFQVFSYPLLEGNPRQALHDPKDIVISDALAIKLFGQTNNLLGKTITMAQEDYDGQYQVSGVFKSLSRSSDKFDFLISNAMYLSRRPKDYIGWHSNSLLVYAIVDDGTVITQLNEKLTAFNRANMAPMYGKEHLAEIGTMYLEPYSNRYLYNQFENGMASGGRIDYVVLFSTIAIFVLLIACINFMNLATARASRRTREIGVKKAMGAIRKNLVIQFLGESVLMAFIALLVSIILVILMLPAFNTITGKQLILLTGAEPVLGILLITIITGLLAGSYPALYLSGFKPVEILKGKLKSSWGELAGRRSLVVFQAVVSILLMVGVWVVFKQISYVQSKNLGYNKENLVVTERIGNLVGKLDPFLQELNTKPGIISASSISGDPSNFNNQDAGHKWPGQTESTGQIEFTHAKVGPGFIETMGIKMKSGRAFSDSYSKDKDKIILNETAINAMNLTDPIGKIVEIRGRREIIGIVKDFHFNSLHEKIKPMYLICDPGQTDMIVIKIRNANLKTGLESLESVYHAFNPGITLDFHFVDEEYQSLYTAEKRVAMLSKYFAGIAVLISFLGLFGLVSYTAERRSKEIGIRKILGSSNVAILRLVSGEFTKMIVLAIVIAIPISLWAAHAWLASFAYRIQPDWRIFSGAALTTLLLTIITVGYPILKAARSNPTISLKSE